MAEEDCNCLVCLDSLYDPNETLGVTSCGHPIHEKCFRNWETSRHSRDATYGRRKVSCPTCNQQGVKFTKIFLPLPTTTIDDGDDSSVSSLESNAAEDKKEESSTNEEEANQRAVDQEEQENSVEVVSENVVDLTASNHEDDNVVKKANKADRTDQEKKLRRRLKKYKQQLKKCESKFRECHKKQQDLSIQHNETTKKLEQADKTIQEQEARHHNDQLDLIQLEKENVSLYRKLDSEITRGDMAEKQLKLTLKAMESQKLYHAEELKEAKDYKTVEQKKIMDAYPKLLEENRKLQEELESNREKMKNFKMKLKELEPKYREELQAELEEPKPASARELQKALAMANEMNNQHLPLLNVNRKRSMGTMMQQSAAARAGASGRAQMMRDQIVAKPKKPKTNRIDDLLTLDNMAKKGTPIAKGSLMNTDHRSQTILPGQALASKRKSNNQNRAPFAKGSTSVSSAAYTRDRISAKDFFRSKK